MTSEKNALVGWWRLRRKKEQVIVANDRSLVYGFFLIVAIFPLGTVGFSRFMDIIKECSFFDDFCTMFGYYMIMCYGSVMNLPVSARSYEL